MPLVSGATPRLAIVVSDDGKTDSMADLIGSETALVGGNDSFDMADSGTTFSRATV